MLKFLLSERGGVLYLRPYAEACVFVVCAWVGSVCECPVASAKRQPEDTRIDAPQAWRLTNADVLSNTKLSGH
ncbi:MAG: hypothetical protein ACKO1L_02405 [Brachymonas sp.]